MHSICVFCSASELVDDPYRAAATELGAAIAARGHRLIYGGGNAGLMGSVARAADAGGGQVLGIIPQMLLPREIPNYLVDRLIVTRTMRERKQMMDDAADAFIALPGGVGTLEELAEILTLKQLDACAKPLVILNVAGYYDPLLAFFDSMIAQRFATTQTRDLFCVTSSVPAALDHIGAALAPGARRPRYRPTEAELREAMESG